MRLLFDARPETLYPLGKPGFSGGSQVYIRAITEGLAANGHEVHVITNDLETDERRGPNLWYWPPTNFPRKADVAVMQMHCQPNPEYVAPICILMTSCIDPFLGPDDKWAEDIDAVPVFSEVHKRLLCKTRPIPPEKCHLTGLGVELADYDGQAEPVPGRMLYANDPARGLFYVLDIFDIVKQKVPHATLHVSYDFDRQLGYRAWEHSQMAQYLWDCKRRIDGTPGIVNVGALERADVIREELESHVHCMPSDPPGVGTQTHGITQMEMAAAGIPLVLSDVEAFPEVFGGTASILPVIGKFFPEQKRRVGPADYAAVVIELMTDERKWRRASRKSRALAKRSTWAIVVRKWEKMLETLVEGLSVG